MSFHSSRIAVLCVLALVIGACSKQPASEPVRTAADDTLAEHALKHTNPKYRCPMHPDVVRDEPGQCPICGMTLVKFDEPAVDPAAGEDGVRISPAVINNLGVRTEPVLRGPLGQSADVVGYVAFDERTVQQVRPRAEGWVEGLAVRAMGETVQQGQLLFTLYSPMLEAAQQEYLDALQIGNRELIDASRERLHALGLDAGTASRLEKSGRAAGRVAFHAPIAGVVTELEAREGAMLTPGDGRNDDHATRQPVDHRRSAGGAGGLAAAGHACRGPLSGAARPAPRRPRRIRLSGAQYGDAHAARAHHARPAAAGREAQHARAGQPAGRGRRGHAAHSPQRADPRRPAGPRRGRIGRRPVRLAQRRGGRRERRSRRDRRGAAGGRAGGRRRAVPARLGGESRRGPRPARGWRDGGAGRRDPGRSARRAPGPDAMIDAIIRGSLANRPLVLLLALMLAGIGTYSVLHTPVDALPDLSDVQVIVRTPYPGQAPRVVEDQVTYPLTSALLSVPGATTVRGYSFYGDSFVNVLFEDGTDPYWARSRVLEYLSQASARLPEGVRPSLGPDATGVGWVYQYALVDRSGRHDLAQLRSLQDWFLKFELQALEGVAEVATVGGMVKQYQVVVDPLRLRGYGIPLMMVEEAIRRGNQEVGGSVIEMAEAEYMVRATGYVKSIADLEQIPVMASKEGTPVLLRDVAEVRLGPEMRRGIGELDGEGEAVGGVIVMRDGENARDTIVRVKDKLNQLRAGLPAGVEIVETYDRGSLIQRAVDNLKRKLLDEFIVVALVCFLFLYHVRSALIIVIVTPLAVASAFIVMHAQGINANIMSLGGIAIAIGTLVDAAIVMIENVHRKLEHQPDESRRMEAILGRLPRGRAVAVLFADDRGAVVPAGVHARGAGRTHVRAARVHQDLRDGRGLAAVGHAGAGADLVPGARRIRPEQANPINRGGDGCSTGSAAAQLRRHRARRDSVKAAPRRRCTGLSWCLRCAIPGAWPWLPPCWCWPPCGRLRASAPSSCRNWTKATCCTCRRRCQACRPTRPGPCCSRPTG